MSNTRSYGEGGLPRHLAGGLSTIQWVDSTLPNLVPEGDDHVAPRQRDLFEPGAIIDGKYEVRRVLGSGGMGQVFEARDLGLNRVVAVKVAWPGVGAASLRKEAQVLAAFRHPGLATVHALGSADGHDFMVMERLSGASLAEFLSRRQAAPLPLVECLYLVDGICEALAPVHASGLAHADLKPANIMLLPGGRIVLLDFGIARIEQLREGGQRISGSPHYMAPEAIRGLVSSGAAHLIDLYALGVIAYVMLVGAPPFDHANPVELMMSHLHETPPKLIDRRPDVPPALDHLVAELLAKEPADRPADIEVVRAELRRVRERS
ncbi:MAG: serine/threonine-protein kinase [Polyangia bacterium]